MTKKNWKADWPKPKSLFSNRLHDILPNKGMSKIAQEYFLGASKNTIFRYLSGDSEPNVSEVLRVSEVTGRDVSWIMTGKGANDSVSTQVAKQEDVPPVPTPLAEIPPVNAIRRVGFDMKEGRVQHFVVPGKAAAFEGGGALPGLISDGAAYQDDIEIPETTYFVRISGDSMSPLMLDGQYALMGPEYLRNAAPPERSIVIAQVTVNDGDQAGSDGELEGVYCKRVIDGESCWWFRSINPAHRDFSIMKTDCRLWPVLGVWFAGHCVPPED